jgi:hypothetical protein
MTDTKRTDTMSRETGTKHDLKQTTLKFDVHVSTPVTEESQKALWPGREPHRIQTSIHSYVSHAFSSESSGQGIDSSAL